MNKMLTVLGNWELDEKAVREHMYGTATARERERWHAMWLLARGWSAAQVAEAWSGMRIRLGLGRQSCARKVRTDWHSSKPVDPPRPRPGATEDIEGGLAGNTE
jgi:hypothetical protein